MGFTSLWDKMKLPVGGERAACGVPVEYGACVTRLLQVWLLKPVALGAEAVGKCFGTTFKLNRFNVRVLTMHRWFDISAAERDLQYRVRELLLLLIAFCGFISRLKGGVGPAVCRGGVLLLPEKLRNKTKRDSLSQPIVAFREGWKDTISWFKVATFPRHCTSPSSTPII